MKLGISPIVNFAFTKLFASEENEPVLRAFLNAILKLEHPNVSLRVLHPFNMQEFEDDKQSIFYGCELYADQLREGDDYTDLKAVYCVSISREALWKTNPKVHHRFQWTDQTNGRTLRDTIEIHTLELQWNTLKEQDLPQANEAERWLYLLLYAQDYEPTRLEELFPELEFLQAIDTLDP